MNKPNLITILSFIMLLSTSVQGSISRYSGTVNKWKILIYMQADNDLAPYAFWDLVELEKSTNMTVPVIVELDLPGNDGIKRLEIQKQEGLKNLESYDYKSWNLTKLKSKIVQQQPENDMSQSLRLMNFLIEAEEKYPSENTMVVIWGHGEGFSSTNLAQFGGVAIDDNPKSSLSSSNIKDSLKTFETIFNKKIDILSMDACLMQTLEVAVELNNSVDYLIGSTQIQNFRGLPYDEILNYLQTKISEDAKELGSESYALTLKIPELSEKVSRNFKDTDKRTMSAINLQELELELLPSLDKLGLELLKELKKDPFNKLDLLDIINQSPFFLGESRDISSLLSVLSEFYYETGNVEILTKIADVQSKMNRVSISYYYGDNYLEDQRVHLGSFRAFGVWLPGDTETYQSRISEFEDSRFNNIVPNWKIFLSELYSLELF